MALRLGLVYIAAVIGAGFASGQEVIQFFGNFGLAGLYGVVISTVMLSLGGAWILRVTYLMRAQSYHQLIKNIAGRQGIYLDAGYSVFMIASVGIMLAGSNEALAYLGFDLGGRYITAFLVLAVLLKGAESVVKVSSYVVPFLILLMMVAIGYSLRDYGLILPHSTKVEGYGSAILYGSYNLGFALAVFAGLGSTIKNQSEAVIGGLLGGIGLGVLLILQLLALWSLPPHLIEQQIPLLAMMNQRHNIAGGLYALVLWIAMYTTALANSLALGLRIKQQTTLSWPMSCIAVLIISLVGSYFGFVALIKLAYPLFGYLGLYLMFLLLRSSIDN